MTDIVDEDLTHDLAMSKIWYELKTIVCEDIFNRPDTDEKKYLMAFITAFWGGHAPRSREVASLKSALTRALRERDEYKKLLHIKPVDRKKTKK